MDALDAIKKRCSLKLNLSSKEVEAATLNQVLEAGRLSPSARNTQPWKFIVIKGKTNVESLVAAAFGENNRPANVAPVIIIVCARPTDDIQRDGKDYYLFDCGLAVENMLISATALGLATHLMTGVDEVALKKHLGIPTDVRMVAVTPLAYPAGLSYNEAARERLSQRTRKGLKEIVYYQKWGEELA